jgi:hypothetical protein
MRNDRSYENIGWTILIWQDGIIHNTAFAILSGATPDTPTEAPLKTLRKLLANPN